MTGDLAVVEQQVVNFYDDELLAIRLSDGQIYVAISHMCDALGLDTQGQVRRMQRHAILAEGVTWVDILSTQVQKGTEHSQSRQLRAVRVDLVPLWLSGVRVSMVKEAIRPKLEHFQREAAKVLWQAFQERRLTMEPDFDALLSQDTPEAQAVHMARAILQLANNQLLMRGQLEEQAGQLATHDQALGDHAQRLETLEATLGDTGRFVTPDQASQISQGVKTVAIVLGKKSGRNEFGAVYGELYRKFGITSYKQLPATRFQEAMDWLNEWREHIDGDLSF